MKNILTVFYPFGSWAFKVKLVDKVLQKDNTTRTEYWIDFRFPLEHPSKFHRITIKR